MDPRPPDLCIITTCRGRLAHLKQTLPSMLAQERAQCVVVDYSCPDHAGDWAQRQFPSVKVVRVPGQTHFNLSRARNAGAAVAEAPWLFFLDADYHLLPGFTAAVQPLLIPGTFHHPVPTPHNTFGQLICARDDFRLLQGYDEFLDGWGGEDVDIHHRLLMAGRRDVGFPRPLLRPIVHADADRVAHYHRKTKERSHQVNACYSQIKRRLMALSGVELEPAARQALYRRVSDACDLLGPGSRRVTLTLSPAEFTPAADRPPTLSYQIVRHDIVAHERPPTLWRRITERLRRRPPLARPSPQR